MELLLFDHVDDAIPARVIRLDRGRTALSLLACLRSRSQPGQIYGWRVHGPSRPRSQRFDAAKVLLDPYGKAVAVPHGYSRMAASQPGDNTATAMKSVVADLDDYDWEGDGS